MTHILAIDQGTTSTRAILFGADMVPGAMAQEEFAQHYPDNGWVEHDPREIWQTVRRTVPAALQKAGRAPADVTAIGITNQRETVVVWDRETGEPVHNAIVWQDRRTARWCHEMKEQGHEELVTQKTGLLLDPYFSSTKLAWILDNVDGARDRAEAGRLLFGTIDSYLIWKLTGGRSHVTDATNACRTMLYDIRKGGWSTSLCELLRIPMKMLPEVLDSAAEFGTTDPEVFGAAVPILGVAGDQQAATIGQACFAPGMAKSTYGTGCFALLNTGAEPVQSAHRLLTTIAYQFDGTPTYALEGSIFVAGAVVQWLRDGLKIIGAASETQPLAETADPAQRLILVPAFTGLGAPYWNSDVRGAVFGLTRNSGPAEMARAALESVGFQTRDLMEAMHADLPDQDSDAVLRVDGGMAVSDWTMQFLADILNLPVDRPEVTETTALGAAWLAGMKAGVYPGQEEFARHWALERQFDPAMPEEEREARYAAWKRAVAAVQSA
ncbi:glycerol kinase GlpK [Mangrovicoccus algicola]|uniref:Glycerol kinase n=1 Tax=Mangrovicoccus algicola TaxID=2771008 RepID=A0A8J6YYG6_9RHOB|nr:glycerol kinase GlpK [Mangrovicoccus algicola]MBE3638929.1 glycerol kinase GlpK [Mangrovicoccus algicola]